MVNNKSIEFAVKALIVNDGKVLIMHKVNVKENNWEIPGGRMEFGETAEDTLLREVMEETGLSVEPIRLLDTWNYLAETYQITGIIYLCKYQGGEVRLSDEHDDYKWVNPDKELMEKIVEVFKIKMEKWDWFQII